MLESEHTETTEFRRVPPKISSLRIVVPSLTQRLYQKDSEEDRGDFNEELKIRKTDTSDGRKQKSHKLLLTDSRRQSPSNLQVSISLLDETSNKKVLRPKTAILSTKASARKDKKRGEKYFQEKEDTILTQKKESLGEDNLETVHNEPEENQVQSPQKNTLNKTSNELVKLDLSGVSVTTS